MKTSARGLLTGLLLLLIGSPAFAQSGGTVTVRYRLFHLQRIASNQLAVWIEDEGGAYVRTLFATDFMARRQGWRKRPQCCPEWVTAADLPSLSPGEVDAVSGATQRPGSVALTWDCTDAAGRPVPDGTYVYKVEGNIAWEKRVLYSGRITLGPAPHTSSARPTYIPEDTAEEGTLLADVEASFQPGPR
jgi:hypothetical protein